MKHNPKNALVFEAPPAVGDELVVNHEGDRRPVLTRGQQVYLRKKNQYVKVEITRAPYEHNNRFVYEGKSIEWTKG